MTGVKQGTCMITIMTKNGLKKTTQIQVTKENVEDDDPDHNGGNTDNGNHDNRDTGSGNYDNGNTDGNQPGSNHNDKSSNARTGDGSLIIPLVIILGFSGIVIGYILYKRKKNNEN